MVGAPSIFSIGDCTASSYAPTAQVASQQGAYLATVFKNLAKKEKLEAKLKVEGEVSFWFLVMVFGDEGKGREVRVRVHVQERRTIFMLGGLPSALPVFRSSSTCADHPFLVAGQRRGGGSDEEAAAAIREGAPAVPLYASGIVGVYWIG